ncbi:Uncharacterised protein [Candidatus Tiddalikarchaeum anstoanum]|nr:Uncharacterised protein [Candidatus Tiddalikarchaeum anstoanum]
MNTSIEFYFIRPVDALIQVDKESYDKFYKQKDSDAEKELDDIFYTPISIEDTFSIGSKIINISKLGTLETELKLEVESTASDITLYSDFDFCKVSFTKKEHKLLTINVEYTLSKEKYTKQLETEHLVTKAKIFGLNTIIFE